MSRIGKKSILIPENVKLSLNGQELKFSGPKGQLKIGVPESINVKLQENEIFLKPKKENPTNKEKALWGLYRSLIANIVWGVQNGFEKKLEVEGVGFKASLQGDSLVLNLGFVNPIIIKKPEGINFAVEKNIITVSGIDKKLVGDIAAQIRSVKKAEPYKGKGIKYYGEKIKRKEGKKVVAAKK